MIIIKIIDIITKIKMVIIGIIGMIIKIKMIIIGIIAILPDTGQPCSGGAEAAADKRGQAEGCGE